MSAQKRKRTDFTLKEKKEIIDAAKKEPNQSKLAREISKKWGIEVKRTTVKCILSKKDAIEAAIKAGVPSKRMKLTQAHEPKLDKSNDVDATSQESIDVKPIVTIESASPSSSNQEPPEPTILPVTNGAASHVPNGQYSHIDEQDIKAWTQGEITMWLTKHSLENSSLLYLSGEEIIFLHKLRYEAPEFFYHCLESKLYLESLLDLSRASEALADLTW